MSRFDDRDQASEDGAALRDAEQDAPGLEIGGPAAVAQAAELMDSPIEASQRATPAEGIVAQPTPLQRQPAPAAMPQPTLAVEALQPAVLLSPDGGGGGAEVGGAQRPGGAAQVHSPGPGAAIDAAAQLRVADALRQQAIFDEPTRRTPVALRRKKKRRAHEADKAEPESQQE